MLNVEQYKRYLALQTRLHGNSMLNVEEYSEYIKLHTQFQDSIYAQPTVSNELINQRDVESNVENNVEPEIIVEKNVDNADNTIINTESIINAESIITAESIIRQL
jgi:protease II